MSLFFSSAVRRLLPCICFIFLLSLGFSGLSAETVVRALDHGLVGDGVADDGPAIARILEAAREIEGPVRIQFPQRRVIRVESGHNRYVFWLDSEKNWTIDGGGSEFRLDPWLRFVSAFNCERLIIRNLQVDYTIQATTPGTILNVHPERKSMEIQLDDPAYAERVTGPTREDGEQAFFGMILMDALHGLTHVVHYYVDRVEDKGNGRIEVFNNRSNFNQLATKVVNGKTRIGLPVSGVAHRLGPGALFDINHNHNVMLEDIEVWSAPWFSFTIERNEGKGIFRNVNVRPKPGSNKVLSSCRDAFHVKGNRAELLFENCELTGLGDDAFNISTHASRVREMVSDSEVRFSQRFPIQYMPFRAGDTLVFFDGTNNRLLGERTLTTFSEKPANREPSSFATRYSGYAPQITAQLDRPIHGIEAGTIVWVKESSNPNTIIRNCTMRRSCRLMTNVVLEDCTVEAFVWFYGADIEGPVPETISIRNSVMKSASIGERLGTAFSVSGWEHSPREGERAIDSQNAAMRRLEVVDSEIWGTVFVHDVLEVVFERNRFFSENRNPLTIQNSGKVTKRSNRFQRP